jgi:uncharacterized linocin/CFP29 family protein
MNNFHRELAPISAKAWLQIEEEATRTLKRHLAARRVVDMPQPRGLEFSALGTGHLREIEGPQDGIQASQREVMAVVELKIPFELTRRAIDDVERGSLDSDWDPLKDAARQLAFAEDRSVFDGYPAAKIEGIRPTCSNAPVRLPPQINEYPGVVARAVSQLRLAGVEGPYCLVLGNQAYTAVSGGSEDGYPVYQHIQREVDGPIVCAPAIEGGLLLTTRGGDFSLDLGQDVSIGYTSHSSSSVQLYFMETFTFRVLTREAAVALLPAKE